MPLGNKYSKLFNQIVWKQIHGSYKWISMLEKCGHPDINVFHIKWIIGDHGNWKNQNPDGRFGATS